MWRTPDGSFLSASASSEDDVPDGSTHVAVLYGSTCVTVQLHPFECGGEHGQKVSPFTWMNLFTKAVKVHKAVRGGWPSTETLPNGLLTVLLIMHPTVPTPPMMRADWWPLCQIAALCWGSKKPYPAPVGENGI